MRTTVLLILVSGCMKSMIAQDPVPFPQKGFRQGIMYTGNFYDKPFDRSIRYVRDTIMCGKTYAGYAKEIEPGKLVHFTRYDSGKVYLCYGCNNEVLQYNFNLKLNDVFMLRSGWSDRRLVVDSIDAFYLPNFSLRKYIRLIDKDGRYYEWLEGIGDISRGLFCLWDFEGGADELTCYKEFNQTLYENSTVYSCNQLLKTMAVEVDEISKAEIEIFPNPAHEVLTIQFKDAGIYSVEIKDMLGRVLYSENGLSIQRQIALEGFKTGMYIVKMVDSENKTSIRKIVVEELH